MTSNINPNDIDGTYPVAGQDNNSQGFRDNFTNTKTNFQYAAQEITDLQNKAVLKAALTGGTLDNNMQGSLLYNAQVQQITETVIPLGTTSGLVTLDFSQGPYQSVTTSGAIVLGFANFPAAGVLATLTFQVLISNVSHTITFPSTVNINTGGVPGLNTLTNVITFPATGYYTFTFSTYTGVTGNAGNVTLDQTNSTMVPFNASYESIAAGNVALSLAVTSSYITIGGLANVTLPTGVNGQIKTIIASGNIANVGNSIVTASGAGWLGAGNITLTAQGSGCTLQSDGTKWWCIGNNGAVFS